MTPHHIPRRCQNPHCLVLVFAGERYTKQRCHACYSYLRANGVERDPETLWRRDGRKSPPWESEPWKGSESDLRIRERLGL